MADQRHHAPPYSEASGHAALEQVGATPLKSADPRRIGPYVPLGLLGSGGMGRVYLARPADDRPRLAAVKVIRPEYAEDTRFRRRFEREAAVHGRVRTPYAPQLLGTGFEDDTLLWMAVEYLPGVDLAEAVRACGGLEAAGLWWLAAELGRALSALADAGVVHRDLKPSNVLLTQQAVHVIDFGISQAVDSSAITTTGHRVGSPAYMAPEYLRDGRCDTASDVFSLGCSLVYAVTGHAPFGDGTGTDVMHRVAFEEPRAETMAEVSALDPALAALLSACLAKDPAGRPTPDQLTDAAVAASHGRAHSWQEPLRERLLARRRGCELLEAASAQQTVHFRTPTEIVASPAPGPAFGPPTPPGAYGPPPSAPREVPDPEHSTKRRKRYLAVVAGLAVVAVAVSAFLFTRPDSGTNASSDTTVETTADDGAAASPSGSSTSPSPSSSKEKDRGDKDDKEKGTGTGTDGSPGSAGGAGGTRPTATVTATPGGDNGGGSGTAPSAAPTKSATKPAIPPWISQCTYYSGTELTRYGDKNQRVTQVQCMLLKRGYGLGAAGVDGQFGDDTLSAVKQFQGAKGLDVDGEVGPNTWGALRSST
ncbi:serine/threonine-protein kinase [Streptomyces spongiae]|uniref:Protein kinase n=1 Tax=Streptomyces spongiae TaxID=565072 RepID=A0A5N8XWJ6_9ACTN|nr:serine/threonine-protein kinase [Streptomyces spongiae]MPY63743.1 protein kinase [Streptomyces spongiae]